jgi:thioredoxin 1
MFSRRIFSRHTLSLVLAAGALTLSAAASALTVKPYSPAALEAAQGGDGSVALHFHAPWCPVCRQQDKALGSLKSDPALDKVTLLLVDYDNSKNLRKALNVEAQSTFVVYKGRSEVARNTGEIDPAKIKSTLMQGL